jgi:hypothetical protein
MSNPFTRGSAPGRARDADQRRGSFKPGHKKVGGRRKGTPNRISADYKQAFLAVADRVGMDGARYFCYLALQYPAAYSKLLSRIIDIQEVYPESRTADQLDPDVGQSIRTDRQPSEDVLVGELTIMAVKHPEAFSTAIAALLPRKRRLYQNPCTR